MKRPQLNEVPMPNPFPEPGKVYITMSPGQWDTLLDESYKAGYTLLEIEEVDGCEKAVRAYRYNPMKTCRKCGDAKEEGAFSRNSHGRNGTEHVCKACRYAEFTARRKANPHKKYLMNRKWVVSHREYSNKLQNGCWHRRAMRMTEAGQCLGCKGLLDTRGPYCASCYNERRRVINQRRKNLTVSPSHPEP